MLVAVAVFLSPVWGAQPTGAGIGLWVVAGPDLRRGGHGPARGRRWSLGSSCSSPPPQRRPAIDASWPPGGSEWVVALHAPTTCGPHPIAAPSADGDGRQRLRRPSPVLPTWLRWPATIPQAGSVWPIFRSDRRDRPSCVDGTGRPQWPLVCGAHRRGRALYARPRPSGGRPMGSWGDHSRPRTGHVHRFGLRHVLGDYSSRQLGGRITPVALGGAGASVFTYW